VPGAPVHFALVILEIGISSLELFAQAGLEPLLACQVARITGVASGTWL
jgi:hypothetical protein